MNKHTLKIFFIFMTLLLVVASQPALGSDWAQFQKDKVNSGITGDSAPIATPNSTMSWQHDICGGWVGIDASPIVYGDYVYAVASDGNLAKYYKDGTSVGGWSVDIGNPGFQNAAPAAGNGHIFVVNTGYGSDPDPDLIAVDASTGSISDSGSVIASTSIQFSTPITYAEDSNGNKHILFGSVNMSSVDPVNLSDGGKYYCYNVTDPTNMVKEWERDCSSAKGYYWAGAAIIGDYAVYGDDAGHLVSVNYTNFTNYEVETVQEIDASTVFGFNVNEIRSSICYSEETGRIYFTSLAGYCYSLGFNANTGQFDASNKWSESIGYSTSTPAYYNGRVYVGNNNGFSTGKLWCLNASDGTEIWNNSVGPVQSSPAISTFYGPGNEYIYVTTNSGSGGIYCVNSSGVTVWSETSPGTNRYCLAGAVISGGWVFYGNDGGYLCGCANYTRYDFNRSTDMWAYKYQIDDTPTTATDPTIEFSSGEKDAIKADDNNYASSETTDEGYYSAHRFVFKIDDNEKPWITSINVTWKGYAYSTDYVYGAKLYIWNNALSTYEELNEGANVQYEFSLNGGVISNIGNYIDNSNNVTVLVVQNGEDDGFVTHSNIQTDYVKLVATP
ncbi:Cell surface protein [Methanosarcina barkeri str. Wiesmoor]|uniref:Cell surface protein n=2 Tax=Methanosarcina barkeri TaxID=2208 RepID=A0A0E3QNM0_METBA|nr:PQQ-binding-like beta-propeller repeat protein [Methanosarcina barkeri]AKB51997.1 Cell surface protein [Methanosarcina barkeri str. Wiesmoor]